MKRLVAGRIMMFLVLIAAIGGVYVYQAPYEIAELTPKSAAALIIGAVLWSLGAWVLIVSGKKARKDNSITQDDNQNCLSCGRWVPTAYLKEGLYCYTCFKKIRNSEEETTHKEAHHRESVQNTLAGRELFPYQAELDRRIFQFLADEKERDAATMVQAMAESDGDKDKARARYFQLRYKQMYEAGEVAEFMEEILEEKAM